MVKKHQHQIEGINSRMDGMQAAILNAKLPYILEWTKKRIYNASLYKKYLTGIVGVDLPTLRPSSMHTYHLFVIRAKKRDGLMEYLKECGIGTNNRSGGRRPCIVAEYRRFADRGFQSRSE